VCNYKKEQTLYKKSPLGKSSSYKGIKKQNQTYNINFCYKKQGEFYEKVF